MNGTGKWLFSVLLSSGLASLLWQVVSLERLFQPNLVERRNIKILRQIFDFSGIVGLVSEKSQIRHSLLVFF